MDSEQELLNVECCSGTGHIVRDGGSHINIVGLNKKGFSRFMVAHDFWHDGRKRPPWAAAILCDACLHENREPVWAVGKDEDDGPIYRVPVCELGDWVYEKEGIR